MVITETITIVNKIDGQETEREFVRNYSSLGLYIERDGVKYVEAIDLPNTGRVYTESTEYISGDAEAESSDYELALSKLGVEV